MDCYFSEYIPTEAKTPSPDEINKLQPCTYVSGEDQRVDFPWFSFFVVLTNLERVKGFKGFTKPIEKVKGLGKKRDRCVLSRRSHLVPLYFFTLVWSVGGLLSDGMAWGSVSFSLLVARTTSCTAMLSQHVSD